MKRAVHWRNASIHTVQSLQRTNRQLSRKSAGASPVISEMEKGAACDRMVVRSGASTPASSSHPKSRTW